MIETKQLTLVRYPEIYDYRHNMVYDSVRLKDADGVVYNYISLSCTVNGRGTQSRTKLLRWAWGASLGDKITVRANFVDNSILRPRIIEGD